METVLITGGSGFIGKQLSALLMKEGYQVIVLSRSQSGTKNGIRYAHWDIPAQRIDLDAIREADHIIHLAGAGVMDHRWTKAYKQEIIDSRVESSRLLVNTLRQHPHQLRSIISSSAIGWYGPDQPGQPAFTEEDPAHTDYLGTTCRLWEESIREAEDLGIRVCTVRTGIVLGQQGGALEEFRKPLRFGIAAILGNGKQIISWIHSADLCRIFLHLLRQSSAKGSYNAVAPKPVSNRELILTMGRSSQKKCMAVQVPAFVLKLILGEQSIEILKSATVSAEKIKRTGFEFRFPNIETALKDLLSS